MDLILDLQITAVVNAGRGTLGCAGWRGFCCARKKLGSFGGISLAGLLTFPPWEPLWVISTMSAVFRELYFGAEQAEESQRDC